jgi:hypothetical protein
MSPTAAVEHRPSWCDWLPPQPWICPSCGAEQLTREASPRCNVCGFHETA